MSYGYSVHGVFIFASEKACRGAVASAHELVEDEDTGFGKVATRAWKEWFRVDGAALNVAIETSGPGDWWFALEGLLEEVSDDAATGFVDARHERAPGLVTRYHAGGDEEELAS